MESISIARPVEMARSFENFYAGHVSRVHRALAVTLGDHLLAREATDEAMTRAYARWRKVRNLESPAGWVYRVGLNWANSWRRKLRRERTFKTEASVAVPPPDPAATAAGQALVRLTRPQRAVIVCRVLLDMSTAETAEILGLSKGTVKSRLSRGLDTLRAELKENS